ncbi:phosphatidylinositol-4- kinase [Coemansia spiralis]|uniref:1-phosphatidylinositol 4-kinase n=2 Tax=Coemansia TaxID=4863 RepID=A0A9W8G711_9FUNG|nr:phosphatidylinositol-4- kinase [Coemansia umbellata]KAJ2621539.1 phosphatidylinositol-4- kinase [Coemansia sp. RSA 1358]KAJ2676737.1 phosphatidylinositol-4- kinase [Coemansia spiralis]
MECFDLHSLILEELSEVLSITCAPKSNTALLASDPVVAKVLAQCPQLPPEDSGTRASSHQAISKRHENAILALAKLLSQAFSPILRQLLLERVLDYLDALPKYSYSFSSFGVDGMPEEHWFLERFVGRLLACAASSPEFAGCILERIWRHLNRLVDILDSSNSDHIAVFALPALLGSMEALEKSPFRYRTSDVLMADALSVRLMSAKVVDNINNAISESYSGAPPTRRTVSLYLQSGVGLSANHVLAQVLLVVRAVLESRLAMQLVENGDLDSKIIYRKNPHQLWELISQLDIHRNPSDGDGFGVKLTENDGLKEAYSRILSFSVQIYNDTRASLLQNPLIAAATMSNSDNTNVPPASRSMLATGMSIMYRCMYTSTLSCMLLGRLDHSLLSSILEHIKSRYAQRLSSLTVVCFRVLATISAFFPSSRNAILAATSNFITSPPECLIQELVSSGRASRDEERLIVPAAAAIHSCMRLLVTSKLRAVSAIHTLFNALSVNRSAATSEDAAFQATLRVARNVVLVLSQLALLYKDSEITSLVVGMICSPRIALSPELHSLAIQCAGNVATIAEQPVFVDIVATALKRITFGDGANDSSNIDTSETLSRLAAEVAEKKDVIEEFFCMVMRYFVDLSVEYSIPPKFKKRTVTPLSVFLPVLDALVSAGGYTVDKEATAEQISLWRSFWFHMVVRGYITEKSYVSAYGRIYTTLAAKSPILVHPSSVNYLETEIEYNSVLQREYSDAGLARLRQALNPIVSTRSQALLRNVGFPHAAFLLAAYSVEIARATSGNCVTVLRYFSNSAVTSSSLLPAIESIADLAISAYVREITSKRWSIEASLAGNSRSISSIVSQPAELSAIDGSNPSSRSEVDSNTKASQDISRPIVAQVRELMVASCHHLKLVSMWAQRFVDKILRAFPQALLDKTVICTLLELVQLVWKSCKAEQEDQFVPVYWFTSQSMGITLQLPDSITYRKTLFSQFSACAKRWIELAGKAAPMELETLLQVYLSTPSDDSLYYEPHIGRALAMEIGSSIKYGITPSIDASSTVAALPANSSSFTYRLGQRDYLRGFIGRGTDVTALKELLSGVYSTAKETPGAPLAEGGPSMREIVDSMQQAAHHIVASPKADRELVRLLVWVPIALFDESLMRATRHMWTMLIVERADVEVLIMTDLTIAWTWLIQQHQGLFSQRFEPKDPFAAKMSYTPSDKSARSRGYAAISHTLVPHMQLIEFITQRFDSVKHLPYSNFNAINAILRILQVTFDNASRITTNALARGPLFMLVHLGFKLLKLGFESSPILETKLRDGLYNLAFRWFALPPRWSFSGSKMTLAREIQILIDTRHTVKSDTPVLCVTPSLSGRWSTNVATLGASSASRASNPSSGVVSSGAQPMTALTGTSPSQKQQHHHQHHHHHHHQHSHLLPNLHIRNLNPLHKHKQQHSRPQSRNGNLGTAEYSNATSATSFSEAEDPERELILNTTREKLKQRALRNRSLLLLLLESEICRMATWANPTDQKYSYFPDVSRFARSTEMSDQGWRNLVIDAWIANPRLAVQLTQRFSHAVVKHELIGLICRYPGELVNDPDALPLLLEQLNMSSINGSSGGNQGSNTAPLALGSSAGGSTHSSYGGAIHSVLNGSSGSDSGLGTIAPLSFREQKFLLYWTAVPPIISTAYLASPVSRNPLALQYSMRALECFPVDVTFFYVPQLVQALRHDLSGYVERAIVSSAQISQHFAHQIIWNMKANMFKDDDSQIPDSLKPVFERITSDVVEQLSGDDRIYYEKEFVFFGEVTGISGKLKPFIKKSKLEKKRKIDEEMRKIKVEAGVYLPSNPDGVVVDVDYDSGRPLQSHAKAPFMATFIISKPQELGDEVQELLQESDRTVTPSSSVDETHSTAHSLAENSSAASAEAGKSTNLPSKQTSTSVAGLQAVTQTGGDGNFVEGGSKPVQVSEEDAETELLSARLANTKIKAHRTLSSGISDAPDLIGILQHEQSRSGRLSRELSRPRNSNSTELASPSRKREASNSKATPVGPSKSGVDNSSRNSDGYSKTDELKGENRIISRLSAIFKVGDDCRQDVLALQLIAVFKNIFTSCGLDLYLYPYRVVATAPGCGVIDVIPNSISRDQMGREKVNSLSDYFATKYHGVDSIKYQQARSNFVQSLAAYSVLSYLLQFKDRHNGNIMLDDQGHIVHVDFGFILDIAPGGITFESAPFKLTTEYIQVMGGSADAQPYKLFCELCIKAYLASRPYAEKIIQVVSLMLDSGLPCFKGETTLTKLRGRFQLDKSEREAAQFMADRISDSYENKRTVLYDQFQKATNGIPY